MMEHLESHFDSTFYGYCNGDILFHSSFIPALQTIKEKIRLGVLSSKALASVVPHMQVFVVGRRVNYDEGDLSPIPHSIQGQDQYINQLGSRGYLFQTDAEDYFIFTKGTMPWSALHNVVIGRPGYDNYLVNFFYYRPSVSLIDTTNASGAWSEV